MDDVIHPALLLSAHRGGGARREARMYGSRLVFIFVVENKKRGRSLTGRLVCVVVRHVQIQDW